MPRELKPCGTTAAYARHLKNNEESCTPCREANAKAKSKQGHSRARGRASLALTRMYPDEYAELIAAQGNHPRRCDRARLELTKRREAEFRRLLTEEFA